jgi:hypothetical protein
MKCFEKAAEKCDSDSLGCVVSSSAWGKHAAVGTGSSFQILWNENQVCLSYQPELIAYISLYQVANVEPTSYEARYFWCHRKLLCWLI